MSAVWFVVGLFAGNTITVFTMCLAIAAKQADKAMGIEE